MRKSFFMGLAAAAAALALSACGKSECRRYTEKFCADQNSDACKQAKERSKDWDKDKCRMERNQLEIEEQSKNMEKELKE